MAKGKRRANGEASYRLRPDHRWEGRLTLPGGKRRSFLAKTRQEVQQKLQKAQQDLAAGRLPPPERLSVAAWLETWLCDTVPQRVRPTTARRYKEIIEQHLVPRLGHLKLARLAPADVDRAMREALATGQAARSVQQHRAVLRVALNAALRHGLVGRNAASLSTPVRVPEKESEPFTVERARAVLAAVKGERHEGLYVLLMGSGLRLGEALGLRWSDVDLQRGVLSVRRSLQRTKGGFTLAECKTKHSRRDIPLAVPVLDALRAHQERQKLQRLLVGEQWQGAAWDLVFVNEKGGPLSGEHALDLFQQALGRAGLPPMRLHDLRHAAASMLAAQGVPPRDVMELLGHSAIITTLGVYTHSTEGVRREAMDGLGRLLWGADPR